MEFKGLINSAKVFVLNNKDKIATYFGATCLVAAVPVCAINTVKAVEHTKRYRKAYGFYDDEKVSVKELIKLNWKHYIPTAVLLLSGGGSLAAGLYWCGQTTTAFKMAYELSEKKLTERLAAETIAVGEKTAKKITSTEEDQKLVNTPASITNICHDPSKPDTSLVYEPMTDRYFRSDFNTLQRDWNILMNQMLNDDYVSLNDWFDTCGLENAGVGEFIGWNNRRGLVEMEIVAKVADTGEPCLMIEYSQTPYPNFDKMF